MYSAWGNNARPVEAALNRNRAEGAVSRRAGMVAGHKYALIKPSEEFVMNSRFAPTGFRWRLDGDPGTGLESVLRTAEAVRAAVLRHSSSNGCHCFPDAFHTSGLWIAEDIDGDRSIDHVLLYAEQGIPLALLPSLVAPLRVWLRGLGSWDLTPVWMGSGEDVGLKARASRWRSITPYVTPKGCRRRSGGEIRPDRKPELQVLEELRSRGFPAPRDILFDSSCIPEVAFTRSHPGVATSLRGSVSLFFDRPVSGPVRLGYASHLGLGLFHPLN